MVGKVTVRGQGPVRRRQTTTTFKKGGRVKLMHGGRPSARTRHIENEKEEIRRVDRNIRRNEGYKTGGRVKKVKGGLAKAGKKVRTYVADVRDATKKMSPHQDPRSERSAKLRHMLDNPPKKKKTTPSPHTPDRKKRTLRAMMKYYGPGARKLRRATPMEKAPRSKKATGGEARKPTGRTLKGIPSPGRPKKSKVMIADTDFHKRKRAAAKDKGKPNTPGEKMRTMQGMYNAGQARNAKVFRGDYDLGKKLRKQRKHHS